MAAMDHATLVFASVFPVPSLSHTTPTPIATPDLGYTAPGSSFGSPFITTLSGTQAHRAVKRNVAWSTATRFLSLQRSAAGINGLLEEQRLTRTAEVEQALQYLLVGEGRSEEGQEESLLEWYTNEARLHFARTARPVLEECWRQEIELQRVWTVLGDTQRLLEQVQSLYIQPLADHVLPFLNNATDSTSTIRPNKRTRSEGENVLSRFQRDVHAIFAHALPTRRFSKTLSYVLYDAGCRLFRIYVRQDGTQPKLPPDNARELRKRMIDLLQGLERVGLGGDKAQKAFAHAMNKLMESFITSHYVKVDWFSRKSIVPHLRMWVRDGFCPLVELVMECLRCDPSSAQPTELHQWQEMALSRLGRARVDNLFDFAINWDKSLGAILDIKEYLKVSGAKQYLISGFSQQISRRLLHSGATTTYILNVYISIIRAFHELEPKGVLLERVARPIRRYLKEREDTARIIISSLLTDINEEVESRFSSQSELSYEIASEMAKPIASVNNEADEELNWNDMNWQPLPTDASPEYKKSKVEDVIWFLLTLWDREDFINELKNILGEHLLRSQDPEYEREIRLLELIKVRLGDDKLQACEVMLRDVLDSKRINATIRAAGSLQTPDKKLPSTPENAPRRPKRGTTNATPNLAPSTPILKTLQAPTLNAQILSSFFWPVLRDDDFKVPTEIQALQREYEARFERIKGMRKLRWMNGLGDATITLDFDDRTEEYTGVTTWQVSVIYAFQPQPGEEWVNKKGRKGGGLGRNVDQLQKMLEMDEILVRQALAFWVGKSILRETHPNVYTVIERASSAENAKDEEAAAAAQELAEVQAQQQAGAVKSQSDLLNEKKDIYMTFITQMLTNQGNLPVQRIAMMMRIMVLGGFPFGADEVKGLLQEMEGEGKVIDFGGDVWGIQK